jgi:methylenetetrahydrofolate reductase (NADPH)
MGHTGFSIVCEVEPATRPDLMHVRHQIGVMSRIASAFLIPGQPHRPGDGAEHRGSTP